MPVLRLVPAPRKGAVVGTNIARLTLGFFEKLELLTEGLSIAVPLIFGPKIDD
jgi:hypothetical protein